MIWIDYEVLWTVFVIHVNLWEDRIYIALKIISGAICSGCHFWFFSSVSIFIIRETTHEMESRTSSIPPISFVTFFFNKDLFCHWTCWWIRKDKTSRWLPFWEYFKRWQGSHKQSYLRSLKLVIHVCCWVLTLIYNVFAVKAHLLVYNSFVEAIFILNDCHAHNGHTDSQDSRMESRLFSIRLVCPTLFGKNRSATEM